MPSDPTKPLLPIQVQEIRARAPGAQRAVPRPRPFEAEDQLRRFGPSFDRLRSVLERDLNALELRADPTALAPERMLVFEVRGPIGTFANAVRRVQGLQLVGEDDLEADDMDANPVVYLLVPDGRALLELVSLWKRWQNGEKFDTGYAPWKDVFSLLRDIRPWGPTDRVTEDERDILRDEIEGLPNEHLLTLEVELIYLESIERGLAKEREIAEAVRAYGGNVLHRSRLGDIAYHALLIQLPVAAIQAIIERQATGLAGLEPIMSIRPQSNADTIEVAEVGESDFAPERIDLGPPILALIDGVPIAQHPLLSDHLVVDDMFGLEEVTAVNRRLHGTAMASLIVHGDRNQAEAALSRRVHVVPVLGGAAPREQFPADQLIVDVIYRAVVAMRSEEEPTAANVIIINLSLGNERRRFHGMPSAWGRLLDRLSYRFGILFIVSAGNVTDRFDIPAFPGRIAFEDADARTRATGVIDALGKVMAERRLFSPAETLNGLTVGAANVDFVPDAQRLVARAQIDPFVGLPMSNPSSALGPGIGNSVKPDLLASGARERLSVVGGQNSIQVAPSSPNRAAGLKVAAPPLGGLERLEGYTGGTSAAAAIVSRTCHRIHDALEFAYGQRFTQLSHLQRAVLLKALLVHPAQWPEETAELIKQTIGPADNRQHVRQRDNIRRFLGYGILAPEDAVACADDRATFWAVGSLSQNQVANVQIPVPACMNGQRTSHALVATVAWFTPVSPGRRTYRSVRLKIFDPTELGNLGVSGAKLQPDANQSARGTVMSRRWEGERAPVVHDDMTITLAIQREPDQGTVVDEPTPFGIAVSLMMPGANQIYEQVRQRLGIAPRINV